MKAAVWSWLLVGGRNPTTRPTVPVRRRWPSAIHVAGQGAWFGCGVATGPVVEQGLGLDRAVRLQIQQGLAAAGFDPGGADGLFGPAEVRVTISVSPGVL